MKKVILFCLALFATSAFATERPQTSGDATAVAGASSVAVAGAVASAGVNARISNDIRNNASAWQAQMQQQRQQQATSVNTGNNSLTVNEAPIPANTSVTYGGEYTVKNVPAVVTGNVYPTAPCMGSSTVGGAGVGFGFSVGSSWTDDECGIRETSRSFNALGLKEDAVRVLCTSKYAATAVACKEK